MRGVSHALTGAAAGVVSSAVAPVAGPAAAGWVGTVLAWSVWSDWDHGARSTAKNMWGPVSAAVADVFRPLVGGHRGATHKIVAPVVVAVALVAAAALSMQAPWVLAVVYAITVGMFIAASDQIIDGVDVPWPVNLAVSAAVGAGLVAQGVALSWLPLAAALGVLVHLAGDHIRIGSVAEKTVCFVAYAVTVIYPFRAPLGAWMQGVTA